MTLPVRQQEVLSDARRAFLAQQATRLVLEIGYCEGNLPAAVLQQSEESVKNAAEKQATVPAHEARPAGMYYLYPQEQSLLNDREKRSLESMKSLVTKDYWDIMGIAYVASTSTDCVFHTDRGAADLTCYRKDGSVVSFTVYDSA